MTTAKRPSDEERAREFLGCNVETDYERCFTYPVSVSSVVDLIAEVRAEASQEKDAEIERLKADNQNDYRALWEAAEAERDALREENARLAKALDVMGEDIADGYLKRAEKAEQENAVLRERVRVLERQVGDLHRLLRTSRLFRGYAGGPLHEPWAAHVATNAEALLASASEPAPGKEGGK